MSPIVFLFDVDNTLLDTDRVTADLHHFLAQQIGPDEQQHYFAIFEQLRSEMGYADYFLIVEDFMRFAADNQILTGPGRGSSAGSLVATTVTNGPSD